MSLSTGDNEVDRKLHELRLVTLAEAKAEEKKARGFRKAGNDLEAIAAFSRAGDLYMDSQLAFQYVDEQLADDVRAAIARCQKIIHNIRHPKQARPPATMPRPNCLHCQKPLPRFSRDDRSFKDGTPKEWGSHGDNRFCTLSCGWAWAVDHAPMPKKGSR